MNPETINLDHLPLQKALVASVCASFSSEHDVVAAVLLGSLADGQGDRISDADIIVFTKNRFHNKVASCFSAFEVGKDIFYCLDGFHNENGYFRKYIFCDFTSAEVHCLDVSEPFNISHPFKVLFDKSSLVANRLTDEPAPKHENFPVYSNGDDGLIWELFDCIKWLSRGDNKLAKTYLTKLTDKF